MDSKAIRSAILLTSCAFALIVALVFYANRTPEENPTDQAVSVNDGSFGPNLSDTQLHAFLNDDTFFDNTGTGQSITVTHNSYPRLYLQAISVCKDIRVFVLDEDGDVVEGQDFYLNVTDSGEYKDVDKDGIITVPDLSAGDYYISLASIVGYIVPDEPMKVTVTDQLSYTVINDIRYLIHDESEIDVAKEDTAVNEAKEQADDTEVTEIKRSDETSFGIDVSAYQGEIDWQAVKNSGVEFAIIRAGYRGSSVGALVEDSYFMQNLEGAKDAGIKVGVYFFTQAVNEVEAVEEASAVIAMLGDYTLDYPIFIDTEGAGGAGRADGLDKDTRTNVCEAFCKTVESEGFIGGVYASRNWYYNNLNVEQLEDYAIWEAEYVGTNIYTGKLDMWQYTSSGAIDGINTRVDLDISYIEIN